MSSQPPSEPPSGPPSDPPSRPPSGPPSSGPSSSGAPTGPPSGPLSGPTGRADAGPPTVPSEVPSGGGGSEEPPPRVLVAAAGGHRRPWWRRPRTLAVAAGVVVVAVALGVVLSNRSTKSSTQAVQTVALQPAGSVGPNPFTGSVEHATPAASASPSATATGGGGTRDGGQPGLYGGSRSVSSCDVPKLVAFLNVNPDKARAWAGVEGITTAEIPGYLHGLTPVVLRADTRVTNHGYSNGVATPFQAVLQSGTAVLVDARGVPRARCACGNPLLPPVAMTTPHYQGTSWSAFRDQDVVTVRPAATTVTIIVLVDPESGTSFNRPVGGSGATDSTGSPSPSASTSGSASAPSSSGSPSGSAGPTGTAGSSSPSTSASHTGSASASGSASGSASTAHTSSHTTTTGLPATGTSGNAPGSTP